MQGMMNIIYVYVIYITYFVMEKNRSIILGRNDTQTRGNARLYEVVNTSRGLRIVYRLRQNLLNHFFTCKTVEKMFATTLGN